MEEFQEFQLFQESNYFEPSAIPTHSVTHSIKKDKNEDRKKKNREYAQKQRDQQKSYVQKLEQENQLLKIEIENKKIYIQELEQRLNIQPSQKIQKITTITKNDIAKYGIFSLLAIVTILQIDLSDKQFLNIQFGDVVFFNCTAPHSTCRHLIDTYTDLNDQVYKVQEIMPMIKEYGNYSLQYSFTKYRELGYIFGL
ncbi:hypothetical protein pb186bvf_002390 [Paramecium bursaria]